MELVPIGNNTVDNLSPSELAFYTMLNEVVKDPTGTAQMIFVYDDDQVAGGSWKYNKFDVADMEKLDKNKIILSGNALLAHELNEQLEKDKMGLKPGQGTLDQDFFKAHLKAVDKESLVLPDKVELVEDKAAINGVVYDKLYYDKKNKKMYGVHLGELIDDSYKLKHNFNPWQHIIKPNKASGKFIIYDIQNPNNYFEYP
ncbi:hypothetical protein CPT77_11085 [Snodgrassella alvi]|uniref:hypothetical protein n=1 Tax=Snodgrassella alvi TaxID=1196083 RepID=UPI000BBDD4EE|nr:hypothetical protein [Snodgrassella alvi]PCL19814.1 hypothetical protein CPT77_11085 [Snodgrassella alvi]